MKARTRNLLIAILSTLTLGASATAIADGGGREHREWRDEGGRWGQQERQWRHEDQRRSYRGQEHEGRHHYRPMVRERVIVRSAPAYYESRAYYAPAYTPAYYPRYEPRIIIDFPTIVFPLR